MLMNFEPDTTYAILSPSPVSLGNKPFLYVQSMILMYPWAMNLGLVVISEFYVYLGSVYVRHREALENYFTS
jgi:hypothetical protein